MITRREDTDGFGTHASAATLSASYRQAWRQARPPKRPQRIVLFGFFGCGNLGNDGSLDAVVAFLRRERPEVELLCVCGNPTVVAQTLEIRTLAIRHSPSTSGLSSWINRLLWKIPGKLADFGRALCHARQADVLIFPGTGILDDFGEKPTGMPYDILKWCIAARLVGTRVAFVSIGAGPIRNRLSRLFMTAAARLAHYRSYRDLQSREFMEGVGFDTRRDGTYPDLAFGLPTPVPSLAPAARTLRVGVGLMAYRGWYGFAEGGQSIFFGYIDKMADFVVHLLDAGHEVRLLTGDAEDKIAVDALVTAVRSRGCTSPLAYEQPNSLRDVMEQIALTDIVVATRFHNIVCALKMGRPTISLSYAKKNDVLMQEMGLGDYCQHVETFDVETLIAQFARLQSAYRKHEQAIILRLTGLKKQLDDQYRRLLASVIG